MPTASPVQSKVVPVDGLDWLLRLLSAQGFTIIGPTLRDGAIVLSEIASVGDLPVGWKDIQEAGTYRLERRNDAALFGYAVGPGSARRFLNPPRETLLSISKVGDHLEIAAAPTTPPQFAFLGLRACELAAIAVQDRVLAEGPFADPGYSTRRESMFAIAVNCGEPAATCFCTSMGTGPGVDDGFDLALTELFEGGQHRLLIEVGSPAGGELLRAVPGDPASKTDMEEARAVVAQSASRMERRLQPEAARDLLAANLDHPHWDDVAQRCLSCANCTLVCPTCFCSAIEDHTSLEDDRAVRVRRWDSCFSLDHSYLHGVGPVRGDARSRYRQWLVHKLSTWWDQFDSSGCVGCGRCITWCPVGIDLTAEVAAIAANSPAGGKVDDLRRAP